MIKIAKVIHVFLIFIFVSSNYIYLQIITKLLKDKNFNSYFIVHYFSGLISLWSQISIATDTEFLLRVEMKYSSI